MAAFTIFDSQTNILTASLPGRGNAPSKLLPESDLGELCDRLRQALELAKQLSLENGRPDKNPERSVILRRALGDNALVIAEVVTNIARALRRQLPGWQADFTALQLVQKLKAEVR